MLALLTLLVRETRTESDASPKKEGVVVGMPVSALRLPKQLPAEPAPSDFHPMACSRGTAP